MAISMDNVSGVNGTHGILSTYYTHLYNMPIANQVQGVSQIREYRAAQGENPPQKEDWTERPPEEGQSTLTLPADSEAFLKRYTREMSELHQAAAALDENSLSGASEEEGNLTEEGIDKVARQLDTLVDRYNQSMQTLQENQNRGAAVGQQLEKRQAIPYTDENLAQMGLSRQGDGALALDRGKLVSALNSAAAAPDKTGMTRLREAIGGENGLARQMQEDALAALQQPSASLLSGDFSALARSEAQSDILDYTDYRKLGAAALGNHMAAGVLMNFAV